MVSAAHQAGWAVGKDGLEEKDAESGLKSGAYRSAARGNYVDDVARI